MWFITSTTWVPWLGEPSVSDPGVIAAVSGRAAAAARGVVARCRLSKDGSDTAGVRRAVEASPLARWRGE